MPSYENDITAEEQVELLRFVARHSRNAVFLSAESELRELFCKTLINNRGSLFQEEAWDYIGDAAVASVTTV
jgi:hypothetical protein